MRLFLKYLINPHYLKNERIQWNLFIQLLLGFFLISIPLGLIIGLLKRISNFTDAEFAYSTIKILFAGIILGPIIEEVLFRFLLKPLLRNVLIFLGFSVLIIIFSIIRSNYIYLIISSIIGCISFMLVLNRRFLHVAQMFILKRFNFIFYLSCILFGLYHMTNYHTEKFELILVMPFLVIPQMIGGAFIGFVRMKYGIIYAILFHSITNIIPVITMIIS
jgi:hypothetical protein